MPAETLDASRVSTLIGGWADGQGPLYARLAGALVAAMQRGELLTGVRLPPERQLADALAISRSTVVASYDRLAGEQLLERRQGSGTYVAERASRTGNGATPSLEMNAMFRGLITGGGGTIDFSLAAPPPAPAVGDALRSLAHTPGLAELGSGYLPAGLPALRSAVAAYLSDLGLPTDEGQVLITTGGQQALGLLASLWLTPGDPVVVENPTYPGALDVYRAARARLLSLPLDEQGARVDLLRDMLIRSAPRLVHVSPTFNNPTGTLLSESRRRELARLAEEFQTPVVEDMVLQEIGLTGRRLPPPIGALDSGWVMTVGSMSKLFWGGLRVGWIRAPRQIVFRLAQLKAVADLGTSLLTQWVCVELLRHVGEARAWRDRDTRERMEVLAGALREHLPSWTWDAPGGGNDLWVRLPQGNAADFLQTAARHGVTAPPGPVFSADGGCADRIRLPFVLDPPDLREGVRRLAAAWEAYLPRSGQPAREVTAIV